MSPSTSATAHGQQVGGSGHSHPSLTWMAVDAGMTMGGSPIHSGCSAQAAGSSQHPIPHDIFISTPGPTRRLPLGRPFDTSTRLIALLPISFLYPCKHSAVNFCTGFVIARSHYHSTDFIASRLFAWARLSVNSLGMPV